MKRHISMLSAAILVCACALFTPAQQQQILISQSASAATLSPTAGMQLWYSADCITYTLAVCATLSNGSTLTTWADRSVNAADATVATGTCTLNTAQINGQPAVTFSSCGLSLGSGIGTAVGAYTAFAVIQRSDITTKGVLFACSTTGCFKYHTGDTSTTVRQQGSDSSGLALIGDGTATATTAWHQMNTAATSGTGVGHSISFRLDRASDGSPSAGTTNYTGNVSRIGYDARLVNEFFAGKIAELLLYNTALSNGDITTTENYLNQKYGL